MRIASEGYPFIAGALIPGVLLAGLYPWHHLTPLLVVGIIFILLGLACMGFFRNPRRTVPDDDTVLVSPADGRVLRVIEQDDEFVGRSRRIDIFLSVFDVHINRMPAGGTVSFVRHRPGRFFSAFKDKASVDNERVDVGLTGPHGNLRVAQIAGIIARRIVCRAVERQVVTPGEIFGLIRFGSRTELTFPLTYTPCVKPGDRVKGGVTILGKLSHDA
ncbi:MAG: phosphatidylserine decarboxylase family protein [candidate division Zixibacteria bacterium]|nr:phosphatidylserine decarboxylase family protein [candidate division Zixibacteria bacterium]